MFTKLFPKKKQKNISKVAEILEKYSNFGINTNIKPIKQFGGEEYLKQLIIHDNTKNEYAITNKINLLRISYSEIKNINWILTNEFKKHNK